MSVRTSEIVRAEALEGLSVSDARLPVVYEQARASLAKCKDIDECADWADKAEALASYARQSQDETLLETAMRIKGRAVRRVGELLAAIEASKGGRPGKAETREGALPGLPTRAQAARDANLSPPQVKQALRVAAVPEEAFEAAVERPKPATITELAKKGTKPSTAHLKGRDPKDYQHSTGGQGALNRFVKETGDCDPARVVKGATPNEYAKMGENVKTAIAWLTRLQAALKKVSGKKR